MSKINRLFALFEGIQSEYIRVHQNRCVVVRNRNSKCQRCAMACTSGAIAIVANEIDVAAEKCIGCGTCATVCPTGALEAAQPGDSELLTSCLKSAKQNAGGAVIACEQLLDAASGLVDTEKAARVTCLGRVDESLLLSLAVAGVDSITLAQSSCSECNHRLGLETAKLVQETANSLLNAWGSPLCVGLIVGLPDAVLLEERLAYDQSRRDFFENMAGKAKTVATRTLGNALNDTDGKQGEPESRYQKVMSDGTLPHFIPDRRGRLLDGLAALGEPEDNTIRTRLWGRVSIDLEQCNACMMCAAFCPTAAISKLMEADTEETTALEHYPGDCLKCRCCEDICPTGALTLLDDVRSTDLLSGNVQSFAMGEPALSKDPAHSMFGAMRKLLRTEQIYER
jgi:formate hydrogenlyase subunit 6/NADH:ubiquinone oxidoreductase subunit I